MWTDSWFIEGDDAYFVGAECQILFKANIMSGDIETMAVLPVKDIFSFRGHPICIKRNDNIYCLPDTENNVFVYSINNKQWKTIDLELGDSDRLNMCLYMSLDKSFFIGYISSGRIISILDDTLEIDYDNKIELNDGEKILFAKIINKSFTLYTNQSNIYFFDCDNKQIIKRYVDGWFRLYEEIISFERFLCSNNNEVGIAVMKKNNDLGLSLKDANSQDAFNFSSIEKYKNEIWFVPKKLNKIGVYNTETKEQRWIEIIEEKNGIFNTYPLRQNYVRLYYRNNNYLGLYSMNMHRVVEIDTQKKKYDILDFRVTKVGTEIIKETLSKSTLIKENNIFTLGGFVTYLNNI